jgi:hypothetical protein
MSRLRLAREDRNPRRWGIPTQRDPRDTPSREKHAHPRKRPPKWRRDGEGSSLAARESIGKLLESIGEAVVTLSRKARRKRYFGRTKK